jgi:Glutamine amidotransferase class-I
VVVKLLPESRCKAVASAQLQVSQLAKLYVTLSKILPRASSAAPRRELMVNLLCLLPDVVAVDKLSSNIASQGSRHSPCLQPLCSDQDGGETDSQSVRQHSLPRLWQPVLVSPLLLPSIRPNLNSLPAPNSHLITRRCRELNVYCEMLPCTQKIKELDWTPKGIILSGSPYSVYDEGAPRVDPDVFDAGVPVLGICYGLQEIAWNHGGKVDPHDKREYGSAKVSVIKTGDKHMDALFENVSGEVEVSAQVILPLELR